MILEDIPKTLLKKNNIGVYTYMYVEIYLEEKKKAGFKSMGEVLNIIIREQPDFKEILEGHIDFLKESLRKTERRRE
jgi:hypothetical protein